VQWVVTTGRTVAEARERALDALGIDEAELEIEVLEEPSSSLFGLRRTDARVRARVRPTRPRPKVDRRNRRKGNGGSGGGRRRRGGRRDESPAADTAGAGAGGPAEQPASGRRSGGRDRQEGTGAQGGRRRGRGRGSDRRPDDPAGAETDRPGTLTPDAGEDAPAAPAVPAGASAPPRQPDFDDREQTPDGATGDTMSDISLDEQEPTALDFVQGLVDAFDVDAEVRAEPVDDEHLEITVTGDDLGLLVGPRGATLNAIQELTRTAVAQQHSGRLQGRLRVDVAGYRARRKEALERFATQQAERVKETGAQVALEPMSPPDRKIVHDAINDIDGVHTTSEGEDRRRHVVILPD
jgi:spoIIIJ-associated protein